MKMSLGKRSPYNGPYITERILVCWDPTVNCKVQINQWGILLKYWFWFIWSGVGSETAILTRSQAIQDSCNIFECWGERQKGRWVREEARKARVWPNHPEPGWHHVTIYSACSELCALETSVLCENVGQPTGKTSEEWGPSGAILMVLKVKWSEVNSLSCVQLFATPGL